MRKLLNMLMAMLLIAAMVLSAGAVTVSSVRQPGAPVVSEVEQPKVIVVVTPLAEKEKASWAVQQELETATKTLNDGDLTKVPAVQEAISALNALNAALKPGETAVKPGTIPVPTIPAVPAPSIPAETVPGETIPAQEPETQTFAEIKVENLVVSEVFHVTANQTGVAVTFEAEGIREGQFLMVMIFIDGQWKVLDFNTVHILEDGKVRIIFQEYGTVAFIVDKEEQARYQAEDALAAKESKKNNQNNGNRYGYDNGNHYGHDKDKKK